MLKNRDADVKGRTLQEESQDGEGPEAEDDKESREGYDKPEAKVTIRKAKKVNKKDPSTEPEADDG